MDLRRFSAALIAAGLTVFPGCAGTVTQWMVNLRTSQGDAALLNKNLTEAAKEYDLALRLDARNAHARAGLAHVLYLQAHNDFVSSKLDQAHVEIASARKYAPGDPAMQGLASQIDQATIRREIVLANYPLYEATGVALTDSLKTMTASQKELSKQLKVFSYDFDSGHLTKAIIASYDMEDEAHHVTQRLIAYRSLVATGSSKARAPTQAETPNLLPIP